jgi:hypothetical protein
MRISHNNNSVIIRDFGDGACYPCVMAQKLTFTVLTFLMRG